MAKRKAEQTEVQPTKKPSKSNPETSVSICIPTSVISSKNAYNLQQITTIVYQIAKSCTIYNISEIVILDVPEKKPEQVNNTVEVISGDKGGKKLKFNFDDEIPQPDSTKKEDVVTEEEDNDRAMLLASLLQFFITPPYLVKTMFSPTLNPNFKNILTKFKYAFKLPKITTLPFMNNNEIYKGFKEGIIIPRETPKVHRKNASKKVKAVNKVTVSKYVNIGESQALELKIQREIPVNSRVTIDLKNKTIVSPLQAYGIQGHKAAFGYHVRIIKQFNKLFTECPIPQGYSSSVYVNSDDYFGSNEKISDLTNDIPQFENSTEKKNNVLLVVGNYRDLQTSFEHDKANLQGVESVGQMFDGKLTIPAGVRIEDAILISLSKLYS
ncbi:putative methyltransferase [Spathaspora sp. JA1]|nr:putative methyltransferase [Spathaspora sp. JA1]